MMDMTAWGGGSFEADVSIPADEKRFTLARNCAGVAVVLHVRFAGQLAILVGGARISASVRKRRT